MQCIAARGGVYRQSGRDELPGGAVFGDMACGENLSAHGDIDAVRLALHGGEGEASREAFRRMPKSDREALIAFLNSL